MIDLRDLVADDAGRLHAWRREPEVNRWMSDSPPDSPEAQQRWVDAVIADPDRRGWIITHKAQPAGFLMLTGLTDCNRRAEWGWYIGDPDARGRAWAAPPRRSGWTRPSTSSAWRRCGPRSWPTTTRR
ncbi:MAG: GNAT family N-acetyltransferase [Caulobacteraceae bacterium]